MDNKSAILREFRRALSAISQLPEQQLQLHSGINAADELALDFGHWWQVIEEGNDFHDAVTEVQRNRIRILDQHLKEMSGLSNAHLWTEDALRSSEEWRQARALAGEVIRMMNWADDNLI